VRITVKDHVASNDEIRERVEEALPVGSSLEQIQEYLETEGKKEGIRDTARDLSRADHYSVLLDMGIAPDTPIYVAVVPREGSSLDIYFVLDEDLRLQRVLTYEYFEGL
jgi:hypothetical protein